jgi:hypothetical protein
LELPPPLSLAPQPASTARLRKLKVTIMRTINPS